MFLTSGREKANSVPAGTKPELFKTFIQRPILIKTKTY